MYEKIIGIKYLHQELRQISQAALAGQSFVVVKNSRPVFRIEPIEEVAVKKKYNLASLTNLQFDGGKNLSQSIDKLVY